MTTFPSKQELRNTPTAGRIAAAIKAYEAGNTNLALYWVGFRIDQWELKIHGSHVYAETMEFPENGNSPKGTTLCVELTGSPEKCGLRDHILG